MHKRITRGYSKTKYFMEYIALSACFLAFLGFKEWVFKKEKDRLMDQIDDLENKVIETSMAKDLTEYALARRVQDTSDSKETVVTEPEFIHEADLGGEDFLDLLTKTAKKENTN